MATSYKKALIKTYPRISENITRDTLYWKQLEFPVTHKEHAPVTHVDFCPVEPYHYAVTSSVKVQVYSCRSNQVWKSFTRFHDTAYCGSFRDDGQLLAAGSEDAVVRMFDVKGKTLLRMFRGHTGPVRVSKFTSDNLRVFSGSHDKSVRVFDISTQAEIGCYQEHEDYVRCGATSQASKDIIVTGSYDHRVKLFDLRTADSALTVDHGHPVESVLMFPGGGVFLSAGGPVIKVWDALGGGRLLTTLGHHHKTITSMCFCSDHQRLVSASLDRHVKIYDVGTYQVVHTLDYPSGILSVGVAKDDSLVAVGMADGLLSVQRRKTEPEATAERPHKKKKNISYRYTIGRKTYQPDQDDYVVEKTRKEIMAKYDKYLKKFNYAQALDAALKLEVRQHSPEVTISIMQELIRRDGLRAALAGRDDKSIIVILKFLQKNISNPKFTSNIIDVANILLDVYSKDIGQASAVTVQLMTLKRSIDSELGYMKQLLELMGSMDILFAASQQTELSRNDEVPVILTEPMTESQKS